MKTDRTKHRENELWSFFLKKYEMKNEEWNWTDNIIPTSQEYSINPTCCAKTLFLLTAVIYETMEKMQADLLGSYTFIYSCIY